MRLWHGAPIPIAGVPGRVYAARGGDFIGGIDGGSESSLAEIMASAALSHARRLRAARESALRREAEERKKLEYFAAGFPTGLSGLITNGTIGGKRRNYIFQKVGTTGVIAATNSLWRVGNQPAAGAAAAAAPGGTVPTDATAGSFPFTNPTNPDTQHFVTGNSMCGTGGNTLLLYDRLFAVAKTMNSTATEAVTGVPTRYQSTTATNDDYAGSNFLFMECGTALPATAHNWATCTYTDQDGNAGATLPSIAGNSSNIINRLDMPTGSWFAPLAAGDTGIKALTQMQCSAAVASGAIDFVIGRHIGFMPMGIANMSWILDGINSAFNLERIYDDACLAFLEITKPATAATTYSGSFLTVTT
jgi:hypothetical protein